MIVRTDFKIIFFLWLTLMFSITSCRQKAVIKETTKESANFFSVIEFNALSNFTNERNDNIHILELNYFDAINTGFIIPGKNQAKGEYFYCRFKILNTSGIPKKFAYKIFFQNESYKFPEFDSLSGTQFELAAENFYGSWSDSTIFFRSADVIPSDGKYYEIVDSINITGNPRDESIFYSNGKNDRWKRNPRVGNYSFLLVVTAEENIISKKIPSYVQNVCIRKGDNFVNPYFYFLFGEGKQLINTISIASSSRLKVIAHPDLGHGIYIDKNFFQDDEIKANGNSNCGTDTNIYLRSSVSQFQHYIDESTRLENIPVIADVLKDNYSKMDYNWNRSFYRKDELISGTPMIARSPCTTVYVARIIRWIIIYRWKSLIRTIGWCLQNFKINFRIPYSVYAAIFFAAPIR